MFIPKRHRDWRPEHMKGRPSRRCHWCVSGPHAMAELVQVLEGPMRFHFCSEECLHMWQEHRHDVDAVEWLKIAAGIRAEILSDTCDANTATGRGGSPALRGVADLQVPMQTHHGLPQALVFSQCRGCDGDRTE